MSEYRIRLLETGEHREAWDLFRASLHVPPGSDEEWDRAALSHQQRRSVGAFGPGLIGTARSFDAELLVPGGAKVPLAAVTGIGVRAGWTRRGVLTSMIETQLADFTERGIVAATLRATEGAIYGRYGYGIATHAQNVLVDRQRARLRPEVLPGGQVHVMDLGDAVPQWPELYAATGFTRPGAMTRPPVFWGGHENQVRRLSPFPRTAVHHGPAGIGGYLVYYVDRETTPVKLHVPRFHYTSPEAFAGLWRFLLSVDLVDEIALMYRPLGEPTALLFTNPHIAKIETTRDETWLRLVDVPAALAARSYGDTDPVVIEVHDPMLPANNGRYRIGPGGAERTDAEPALRVDAEVLAMLYFGAWNTSALATANRVDVLHPAALPAADLLFRTEEPAWCGTFF
ncbi:GNAT family N-acetyltransferase [Amycolatopsis panacis]|uniref:GNAT family N-acetyltransferase n=1 Tax=Amycolatopsis panacis TaxID=2340917 RepID=A0A419I7L3_9PSEU|nr:GNAT family N-acetyltransferase [Amycolatopsis panacis]RJQ87695.1 GNAT family N-acetyltransferase [Amycolatopsis panacis]